MAANYAYSRPMFAQDDVAITLKTVDVRNLDLASVGLFAIVTESEHGVAQEGRRFDSQWGHCLHPSGRIMALVSTQPLTEMSIRDISC